MYSCIIRHLTKTRWQLWQAFVPGLLQLPPFAQALNLSRLNVDEAMAEESGRRCPKL